MSILLGLLAFETMLLGVSAFFLIKFSMKLIKLEDVLEDCLDVLDKRYASISKVLEIPLFYDSPEVRKVHEDIKAARDSILLVANTVAKVDEDQENDNEG
jgi:hypothetical protein